MVCKNCENSLNNTTNFCSGCGAKVIRNQLTIKALLSDFNERYVNYDNKFLKTFIGLFLKPEQIIDSYINGTRKKYVDVISYFAIAVTISGLQVFIIKKFFPESIDLSNITTKGNEAVSKEVFTTVQEYVSFVMLLSIPLYAIMAKVVFFNKKKYNFTELIVIFMYTISQMSLLGIIIIVPILAMGGTFGEISYYSLPIQIMYYAYCLKRLYELNLKNFILKTLLFFVVLLVFYIAAIILFVLGMFIYYGNIEDFTEAMKQMQPKQ
jgi:hypothetical protein